MMRMMKQIGAIAAAALAVAGCQSDKVHAKLRAKPSPISSFIPDKNLLVQQPDTFPFHYFYLDPQAKAYENIYIAPANIDQLKQSSGWAEFDKKLAGNLGNDVEFLRDYMRKAYVQGFEKETSKAKLKVVEDRNLPNTLVLEPAIIAIAPSKAELNTVAVAGSFVCPVIGAAMLLGSGSLNVECVIRDAQTGKIVAMYADTEKDPDAIYNAAAMTWTRTARINMKEIAENTAKVLSAKDYKTIRRRYPIRFAALIKDADLDK